MPFSTLAARRIDWSCPTRRAQPPKEIKRSVTETQNTTFEHDTQLNHWSKPFNDEKMLVHYSCLFLIYKQQQPGFKRISFRLPFPSTK